MITSTAQMSAEQIRTILINDYQMNPTEVMAIKGKKQLANTLLEFESKNNVVREDYYLVPEDDTEYMDTQERKPKRFDPNWTEYILSQLTEDEKDQEYPKTCGLGRLLEKEIAPILSLQSTVIQAPAGNNNYMATVKTTLTLQNGEIYEACADAQKSQVAPPYDKHITAIAETRSEGRAYRRALKLTGVVTQEEMISAKEEEASEEKVSKNQILFLETMCLNNRLNINIDKLLRLIYPDRTDYCIDNFSHTEIIKVIQQLTAYQNDVNTIPESIKGFDPSWK